MIQPVTSIPGYIEVVEDMPIILTVPSTARAIFQNIATKWVTSYLIRVRSMGTATYIRVGNQAAQLLTLNAVGAFKAFECRPGELLDMTQVYVVSDTADAVIEVICTFIPVRLMGNVVIADGET
jgi:hypothetical protein